MLRVRLKTAATVPVVFDGKTVRHDWMPAGAEVDLPEEDFNKDVHEVVSEAPPHAADAPPSVPSVPAKRIEPVSRRKA